MPKKTFQQANASGHRVLVQLKDNQSALLKDVSCLQKNKLAVSSINKKLNPDMVVLHKEPLLFIKRTSLILY
ncbi:MAG: hypothetical protein BGN92_11640 [Sphingobacteriales bacterium 41-5]|nr:MAG: hypothetical protein BGN92_11640 [Sphingobacteriales bacterium 41-5]